MKLKNSILTYFPDGFEPRDHQVDGLNRIADAINTGTKFIIVQAPTGSGKSFFSKTLANTTDTANTEYARLIKTYAAYDEDYIGAFDKFAPHGAFVLTTTKNLQNQYKELFPSSTLFKGKINYQFHIDNLFYL